MLFTHNEPRCRGGGNERRHAAQRGVPGLTYREMEDSHELAHIEHPEHDELLTLNLGPHHPATHGVLRLITTLEGEVVRDIKPVIGYVHTGIEKNCEDKAYWKVIPLVERMDYLSYYFNAMAFCGAVETLLDIEVPKRAQYLRVAHMELNRIASHLLWLATGALDLGAMSVFWYGWRDRDLILDLFEMSSGQRMHPRYFQVGGVAEDIPAGWVEEGQDSSRPRSPSAPGPVLGADRQQPDRAPAPARRRRRRRRHAARPRRHRPAAARRRQPVGPAQGGAVLAATRTSTSRSRSAPSATTTTAIASGWPRCASRLKIIDQAVDGLPEGDYITSDRKYALPPRHELATSMEALIHHFKLVTEGFRVPPGEAYYPIESPRGELGCFVRSDGSSKPARVHMRDPSFVNLQAFKPMVQDLYIADLIAALAMLDPILGGIDR